MDTLALIVFIVFQILFIPLAIIGAILYIYKQFYGSKKLGASATATNVITHRWMMDVFGLREDKASVNLYRVLPNNSYFGVWLILFPLYLRYRISGKNPGFPSIGAPGEEKVSQGITNRTLYFDRIIKKTKYQVVQFVVMGAGFDTRCYGDLKDSDLILFELDQPKMHQVKKDLLKKAGIDADHVTFVSVDFSSEHWYQKLEAAGYDPDKKSLFLWEGVTIYLSEADVRKTLCELKQHCAPGSILAADFYSLSHVKGELYGSMIMQAQALKVADEEMGFGLDFSADYESVLKTFVESENASLGETYFIGSKTQKGTYMVVAEIYL